MADEVANKIDVEFQLEEIKEVEDQSSFLEEVDIAAKPNLDSSTANLSSSDEFELETTPKPNNKSEAKKAVAKEKTAAPVFELGEEELAEATQINQNEKLEDLPDLSALPQNKSNPESANENLLDFSLGEVKQSETKEAEVVKASDNESEGATQVLKLPKSLPVIEKTRTKPTIAADALEALIEEDKSENFNLEEKSQEFRPAVVPKPESMLVSKGETEESDSLEETQVDMSTEDFVESPKFEKVQAISKIISKEKVKSPVLENVKFEYDENEMLKLQATIRHLRDERECTQKDFDRSQDQIRALEKEKLTFKAELDELKIENSIIKKRHSDQLRDFHIEISIANEKKSIYESKIRQYQLEILKLNDKVRVDVNKVRNNEKDLEGKLEILTMDTSSQIQARDQKIIELKRKIDSMEFNMEAALLNEKRYKEEKNIIEERLNKIINSLKNSLRNIEDDMAINNLSMDQSIVKNDRPVSRMKKA